MMLQRAVVVAAALFLCLSASAAQERFRIFFDQKSAALTNPAHEVIEYAVKDIREKGVRNVVLVGHADTADMAPMALSRFRAQAVAAALRRGGVPESVTIAVSGVGADKPVVPTGPDVHEPYNRVVVISY